MSDDLVKRETRTQELHWFFEIGACDGNGVGRWEETVESYEVYSKHEAEELRDKLLAEGKLYLTPWGEFRPKNNPYGGSRIRAEWKPAADRIEELEAELHLMKTSGIVEVSVQNPNVMEYMKHWESRAEAAEAKLAKATALLNHLHDRCTLKPNTRETIRATLAELKGDVDV